MLEKGTKAPEFTLPDQNGDMHTLSEYVGRKLILYFYPKDNTSGCSAQAKGYSAKIGDFAQLGITVVGVSGDSVASHKKFEKNHFISFTLLSDVEKNAITAYDIWKEKKLYGKVSMGVVRTTYLIDENGIIIYACDKVKAASDADALLEKVKSL